MYDVTSIQNLKKDVLYFVAKASFEGTLEEERDLIPEKMIEGPEPTFRCCIYKERECKKRYAEVIENSLDTTVSECYSINKLHNVFRAGCKSLPAVIAREPYMA